MEVILYVLIVCVSYCICVLQPQDPYIFGQKAQAAMRSALNLCYLLLSFLYMLFHHALACTNNVAQPLFLESMSYTLLYMCFCRWIDKVKYLSFYKYYIYSYSFLSRFPNDPPSQTSISFGGVCFRFSYVLPQGCYRTGSLASRILGTFWTIWVLIGKFSQMLFEAFSGNTSSKCPPGRLCYALQGHSLYSKGSVPAPAVPFGHHHHSREGGAYCSIAGGCLLWRNHQWLSLSFFWAWRFLWTEFGWWIISKTSNGGKSPQCIIDIGERNFFASVELDNFWGWCKINLLVTM